MFFFFFKSSPPPTNSKHTAHFLNSYHNIKCVVMLASMALTSPTPQKFLQAHVDMRHSQSINRQWSSISCWFIMSTT